MQQITETFFDFVRIPSPTGEELHFSHYLKGRLKGIGLTDVVQDERGNIIASFGSVGEPLLLVAHLDTLPTAKGIEPLVRKGVCKTDGSTILGADNKAVVANLFELAKWATRQQKPLRKTEILFSVSQESELSGIKTVDLSEIESKQAVCIDASLPPGNIILGGPSYRHITITFTGKTADASTRYKGYSALPALSKFLQKVPQGSVHEDVLINFGKIEGGEALNRLLSEVTLQAEIRSFNEKLAQKYLKKIEGLAHEAALRWNCKASIDIQLEHQDYSLSSDHSVAQHVYAAWKASEPRIHMKYHEQFWGRSDANNLNARGIPTINLGYGVKHAHSTKERISQKDLVRMQGMLRELVKDTSIRS